MTNPFNSPFQEETSYIYVHLDPYTREVLYVGRGSGSRAWMYAEPFRAKDHADYLINLVNEGFLPDDWTEILERTLTKDLAHLIEQEQIKLLKPRFNKTQGPDPILKGDDLVRVLFLRAGGLSFSKIAKEFGVSTSTIFRAVNRETSIEE